MSEETNAVELEDEALSDVAGGAMAGQMCPFCRKVFFDAREYREHPNKCPLRPKPINPVVSTANPDCSEE